MLGLDDFAGDEQRKVVQGARDSEVAIGREGALLRRVGAQQRLAHRVGEEAGLHLGVKTLGIADRVLRITSEPFAHVVTVQQQQAVVGFDARVGAGVVTAAQRLAHQPFKRDRLSGVVEIACRVEQCRQPPSQAQGRVGRMLARQLAWQRHRLGRSPGQRLGKPIRAWCALLQPAVQRPSQSHGVGRDDKALRRICALATLPQGAPNLLGKQAWPESLERRQAAQVFALLGPGRALFGDQRPQRVGLLAVGTLQLRRVGGQPLALAGQRAAPAGLRAGGKRARRLGRSQRPFGQVVYRRVEHARIGREEGGAGVAVVVPMRFLAQHLPGRAVQEAAGLTGLDAEEGRHRGAERAGVQVGLTLDVARPDQRERHRRPVHFREAGKLFAHLAVAVLLAFAVQPCGLEQAIHHRLALRLHPIAHGPFALQCQRFRPGLRHQRDKAVGQGGAEQWVGVGGASLRPFAVLEPVRRQAAIVAQPQVHLRHAAQAREQHRVRPQRLTHGFDRLPGQARQQVRAGPQVRSRARGLDEALHRSQ